MSNLNIPKHVALIMDGNRRWAEEKGLSSFEGHRRGEECLEPIVDEAIKMGVAYLTFWAFSTENWKRSKREVNFLLNLYRKQLDKKVDSFHKKNVKVKVIGNLSMFPVDIQRKTKEWMRKTKDNRKITVNIALSYGGRDEIMRAISQLRASLKFLPRRQAGKVQSSKLTMRDFEMYLDTAGQPDPDLLIRTGGEKRLSGFLLWQIEYTELYFTDLYWPDFTPGEFKKAILEYQRRRRRFGR